MSAFSPQRCSRVPRASRWRQRCRSRGSHTRSPSRWGRSSTWPRPRMGALWHLDVTPGVDAVFDELGDHYEGPVTVTQDLTVFNVTADRRHRSSGEGERRRTTGPRGLADPRRARVTPDSSGVVDRGAPRRLTTASAGGSHLHRGTDRPACADCCSLGCRTWLSSSTPCARRARRTATRSSSTT